MNRTPTSADDGAVWRRALAAWATLQDHEDASERGRMIDALERDDPRLHACVLELCRAEGRAPEGFLESLPLPAQALPVEDLVGRQIGPWTVVRELGAGGMGRVWLARRADGRYEGQVAIKLPTGTLAAPGHAMRFEREGRILAGLAHPGIARLVDAGATPEGRPYLVLEYVEGQRIDTWCDERGLDVRERVSLFVRVCDAVAYAHANLVVHRDLKPSNILVTAAAEVKLLDFGIAKLVDAGDGAAEETEITRAAGHALTPEYAAPEQVLSAPITTATDVYALGVVLYRLLSGASPYLRDDGTRPAAFELQKHIVEREPRRMSLAAVPGRRRAALQGDLDNIVVRALRKEPAQRYGSAQALRDDLRRYLEYRPVEARGDSAPYVLARFVRRHRLAVAGAGVVFLAAVAGAAGVAWQARIAQVESAKAKAVSAFLTGIFKANSTDNPDPAKARATTARELLDIGRDRVRTDLAGNPEVLEEVLYVIGQLYYELGLAEETEKLDAQRIEVLKASDGEGSARYGAALAARASTLTILGRYAEAQRLGVEALAILDAAGDRDSEARGLAMAAIANAQRYVNPANSVPATRAASEYFDRHHPDTVHNMMIHRALAVALQERGEFAAASVAIDRARVVGERLYGPERRLLAFIHQIAGIIHQLDMRPELAVAAGRRAVEIDEKAVGPDSDVRPIFESNLARAEAAGPAWEASRERLRLVAAKLHVDRPAERRNATITTGALATVLALEGDVAASRRALSAVMPAYREIMPKPMLGGLLSTAAELELAAGDVARAQQWSDEFESQRSTTFAGAALALARADLVRARLFAARGDAAAALQRLEAIPPALRGATPLQQSAWRLAAAQARIAAGDDRAAESSLRELLAALEARPDRAWFAHVEWEVDLTLAGIASRSERVEEARRLADRAVALLEARQSPSSPRLARARELQAALRAGQAQR